MEVEANRWRFGLYSVHGTESPVFPEPILRSDPFAIPNSNEQKSSIRPDCPSSNDFIFGAIGMLFIYPYFINN
jgi:hypothetical protein